MGNWRLQRTRRRSQSPRQLIIVEVTVTNKSLSNARHDAVKNSPVGRFIDRLIREEVARGGNTTIGDGTGGNVIQLLWAALNSVKEGRIKKPRARLTQWDGHPDS